MTVAAGVQLARPRRWPAALAWVLWVLVIGGLATAAWLDHLLRQAGRSDLRVLSAFAIAPTLACVSAATVGAVLASRRPRHPVGWLLLGFALSLMPGGVTAGYLAYGVLARPGALPATTTVARYYPAMSVAAVTLLGFILLLTPTGSLPSPRWRWWAKATAAAPVALLLVVTVAPGSLDPRYQAGVGGPMDFRGLGGALLVANQLALVVTTLAVVIDAGSLVVRFRRAHGVERQQLRWVALAAALVAPLLGVELAVVALGTPALLGWATTVGAAILPLAVGAAILRYRLYDLDRIISRTLAYGLLTVLLGLGYAGVVLGLGRLLPQGSSLVVAAATLAVAAVVRPARRHIQAAVDRRFNRRRHDAAQTIAAFSGRLHQQIDLDTLTTELLNVVEETMQPTQASLWLRPSQAPSGAAGTGVARQHR
jgi:uncharacterized membrane protein